MGSRISGFGDIQQWINRNRDSRATQHEIASHGTKQRANRGKIDKFAVKTAVTAPWAGTFLMNWSFGLDTNRTDVRGLLIDRTPHQPNLGVRERAYGTKQMMSPSLVLMTVNAPYSHKLDALELVHCLLNPAAAKAMPGHMSSFFGEVTPALQVEFANMFNITEPQLSAAAKAFAMFSGESYPLAA